MTVIAGASHGVHGAVTRDTTQPNYLDLHLPAGSRFAQQLPAGHNAFVYVYRGEVSIGGKTVPAQRMAILANEVQADGVVIEAIVQYGPFVMNSQDEIYQALSDFRDGRLGETA